MSSTTVIIDHTDAIGLTDGVPKSGREVSRKLVTALDGFASGNKRATSMQVFPDGAAPKAAVAHIKLTSCAAGTIIDINGAPFTAIAGTAIAANDEFDIDGSDAADSVDLARAINASTHANISKLVKAVNPTKDILTPSTAIAGDTFYVTLADGIRHTFFGVAGAATAGGKDFSIDTSNAATATSIVAQVAGYAPFANKLTAIDGTTIVTFRSLDGNTFTLVGTASTLAESGGTVVTVSSIQKGGLGNALQVKTLGIAASGTITPTVSGIDANDTVTINGQAITAKVQRATGTLTAVSSVAGDTFVLRGYTFTAAAGAVVLGAQTFSIDTSDTATATSIAAQINGFAAFSGVLTATSAVGVVTIRAVDAGTGGNAITLVGTAVTLAASAATLEGGIAVANDEFDISSGTTDAQCATDIARCINASTTALINRHVRADVDAGVCTVWSRYGGKIGNCITLASSDAQLAVSGARLTGGTVAQHEGVAATGTITISSGSGAIGAVINGVTISITWATSDNNSATLLANAINESEDALVQGLVDATVATNVVTITAQRGGWSGNAITLAATGTGATASVARLATGALPTQVGITNATALSRTNGTERLSNGTGGAVTATTVTFGVA